MSSRARAALVLRAYEAATGRRPYAEFRRLERLQWIAPAALRAAQDGRLAALLAHAGQQVPYFRDLFRQAGLRPDQLRSIADLARLPLTTRAELRAGFPDRFTAVNLPARRRIHRLTSGSSGQPLEFFADRAAEHRRLAAYLFSRGWAGAELGQTMVYIASPAHGRAGVGSSSNAARLVRRVLLGERFVHLSGLHLSADELCARLAALPPARPFFVWGFPSYLTRLAADLEAAGRQMPRTPSVVISYGESLLPADSATIGRVFRGPIVNHYTCWEVPHLAQSCPDNPAVFHQLDDRVVLRVVRPDGADAALGEPGRLALTDLTNLVMPLINYEVGDVASLGEPCPCGRGLPTLLALEGRQHELIRTPSGRVLSPVTIGHRLAFICQAVPYIWEYQLVQTAPNRVVLRIVPTPRFTDQIGLRLAECLRDLFAGEFDVAVQPVPSIPPEPSGKRLITKTELPD